MRNHTDLLNLIAKKINAQVYIEIGVYNPEHNFNKTDVPYKWGVDPDPSAKSLVRCLSDEFFPLFKASGGKADLVFVDGLHHAHQVRKDIINAWSCLNMGGVIVVHDCNPHSENITHVPRDNKEWTGDVYRTVSDICSPKITLDFDYGCCVIRKERKMLHFANQDYTWEEFNVNRKDLLKLVTIEEGVKAIEAWT